MAGVGFLFKIEGYVRAELTGGMPKAFFNDAINRGVELKLVRSTGGSIRFFVRAADYAKLRHSARRCGGRLHVRRKRGLPFLLRRFRYPLPLFAGLCTLCAVLALLGNMVFTIRVTGNSTVPRAELLAVLQENGLAVGDMQSGHDYADIANRVMLSFDRFTWMTINPHFGVIEVEVWDKIQPVEPLTGEQDVTVVATKDAQIKTVRVTSGHSLVVPGEIVTQGQLLVEPNPFSLTGSWAGAVQAEIIGYTTETVQFEQGRIHVQRAKTGKTRRCCGITVAGSDVFYLFAPSCHFRFYDTQVYTNPLYIFGVELPFRLEVTEFAEIEQTSMILNETQAQALLLEKQRAFEQQMMEGWKILNRHNEFTEIDGCFVLNAEYLCEEEIGLCIYP